MADDTKITFTPEQQAKIDEIIRERMGAAGREAREAAEAARKELRELKARLEQGPIPTETPVSDSGTPPVADVFAPAPTPAELELAKVKEELASVRRQRNEDAVHTALESAARECRVIDPSLASQLLQQSIIVDDSGNLQVIDPATKTPRLNADFTPMSISQLAAEFAAARPYLVYGDVKPGAGSSEEQRVFRQPPVPINRIFGRGSSAKAALQLKQENPEEYARLKRSAKEQGLI
jgi:hypothetical protein